MGRISRLAPSQGGLLGTGCCSPSQQPQIQGGGLVSRVSLGQGLGLSNPSHSQVPMGLDPEQLSRVLALLLATRQLQTSLTCLVPACTSARLVDSVHATHITEPEVKSHLGGKSLGVPGGRSCCVICISGPWRHPSHLRC